MNAGAARSRLLRAVTAVTAGIVLAATAVVVTLAVGGPGASGEVVPVPATGVLTVTGHGNGHGHGLSQYGSRGAAIAGLSAAQIVAFYYPGTTLSSVASKTVRVLLSSDGGATTVQVKAGLSVTGVAGTLPTATYTKWRLVPSGAGLSLQAYGGAGWLSYKTGLPARADFSASDAVVREYKADGSSADYYGTVGAVRSGTGLLTVNRVSLDLYTQGVAPRETPASWPAAALQAQAIAARSYAYYAVSTHASSIYDICDTTSCQVYGGKTRYSAAGTALYSDAPAALAGNNNKVLLYRGAPVFAQYAASNGGATLAGGQPYLPSKADPYDNAASGDPYLNWTRTATASSVAGYFGLASVTKIEITGRSGAGAMGGWVTAGYVDGRDSGGRAQRIAATGNALAAAMNLPTAYFEVKGAAQAARGHLDIIRMASDSSVRVGGWAFDPASPTVSTNVEVTVATTATSVPANRSRTDVAKVYKLPSALHGFDVTVAVTAPNAAVCVSALDASGLTKTALGCKTFGLNARGSLAKASMVDNSHLYLGGWAFDPDTNGNSAGVVVTVGNTSYPFSANFARADVQSAFGLSTGMVGFNVTVPLTLGTQTVCISAKNVDSPGADLLLNCREVLALPAVINRS